MIAPHIDIRFVATGKATLDDLVLEYLRKVSTPQTAAEIAAHVFMAGMGWCASEQQIDEVCEAIARLYKAGHVHPETAGTVRAGDE